MNASKARGAAAHLRSDAAGEQVAIVDKRDAQAFLGPVFVVLAWLLSAMAVVLMVMGIATGNITAFGFSVVGIVHGGAMLGFLRAQPASAYLLRHWLAWRHEGRRHGVAVAA